MTFEELVKRVMIARQYEDRAGVRDRVLADGVSDEEFFFAWKAADLLEGKPHKPKRRKFRTRSHSYRGR